MKFKLNTISIITSKELQGFTRLDAEYYQPKYDQILNAIQKLSNLHLTNIVNIKKGIEVGSKAYNNEGISFVRVSNMTKYGFVTDN